jgi:hypothetical protein
MFEYHIDAQPNKQTIMLGKNQIKNERIASFKYKSDRLLCIIWLSSEYPKWQFASVDGKDE